jgi:hypothetical protein
MPSSTPSSFAPELVHILANEGAAGIIDGANGSGMAT